MCEFPSVGWGPSDEGFEVGGAIGIGVAVDVELVVEETPMRLRDGAELELDDMSYSPLLFTFDVDLDLGIAGAG